MKVYDSKQLGEKKASLQTARPLLLRQCAFALLCLSEHFEWLFLTWGVTVGLWWQLHPTPVASNILTTTSDPALGNSWRHEIILTFWECSDVKVSEVPGSTMSVMLKCCLRRITIYTTSLVVVIIPVGGLWKCKSLDYYFREYEG